MATAGATTMETLHPIRRLKEIEREDFNRVAAQVKRWRLVGVSLVRCVGRLFDPQARAKSLALRVDWRRRWEDG